MNFVWGFISGFLINLLGNYFSPFFRRKVSSLLSCFSHLINPNRFDLSGTWEHHFQELNPPDLKEFRQVKEIVTLKQFGNIVTGKGTTDIEPREFAYKLSVMDNLVFGYYEKEGQRGNISGNGMIQLIVSPDRLIMRGQSTWYDRHTGKIETSESLWNNIA